MISYVKSTDGATQWGSNVSDHATAMVNTKLEFEPQPTRLDELELTLYLLRGTGNLAFEHLKRIGPNPAYSSAPPKQIVQDYLTHIYESACKPDSFRDADMTRLGETNTPLDVVVTVPAVSLAFKSILLSTSDDVRIGRFKPQTQRSKPYVGLVSTRRSFPAFRIRFWSQNLRQLLLSLFETIRTLTVWIFWYVK